MDKANYEFTDREIFTRLWTSPRSVFRFINNTKYDKYVFVLLFLWGFTYSLQKAAHSNMGDHSDLLVIIISTILFGGIGGWISIHIYGVLLHLTGNWLKAKGKIKAIVRVLAYSLFPVVLSLLLFLLQIIIYGKAVFQIIPDISEINLFSQILFYSTLVIQVILSVWSLILMVIGLSEVQKISIRLAVLNLILPPLFIIIPIVLIVGIFG